MSNHIEWIDINNTEDALRWFKLKSEYRKNIKGKRNFQIFPEDENSKLQPSSQLKGYYKDVLPCDPDSSPEAWEHYREHYTPTTFGKCKEDLFKVHQNKSKEQSYSFSFLGNYKSRLFALPKGFVEVRETYKNGKKSIACEKAERIGGETDFNFKNEGKNSGRGTPNKYQFFLQYCTNENKKLLDCCPNMHHTLLNFSLMQGTGGLNNFKGSLCDCDRLDRFVFFLDQYYKTPMCDQRNTSMCDQRNTPIVINAEIANRSCLVHYLNQFSKDSNNKEIPADKCIYNYCAKIYFLPTKDFPTGMMTKMEEEKKATFNSTEWENLFKNNKKLIDDLVKWGAEDFKEKTEEYQEYNRNLTENYMLLAVRFWQAKEFYFNLIDEANETSKQTKKE